MTAPATYEVVMEWMKIAEKNCKKQGKTDSAALWHDALFYLEKQNKTIEAQAALLVAYRVGKTPPEWVFDALATARETGILK